MNPPAVSIVIPAWNAESTLRTTLESVRWQTFPDWECLVVDDGSTDGTSAIVERAVMQDRRFRLIRQSNQGLAGARNSGIAEAQGEFVQLLDADDLLLPGKLQSGTAVLLGNESLDACYSEYALFSGPEGCFQTLPARIPGDQPLHGFLFRWNRDFIIPVHAFLFRRKTLLRYPFRTLYGEDVDCWIRMAAGGVQFHYLDEIGVLYRISGHSMTRSEARLYQDRLNILQSHRRIAEPFAEELAETEHWLGRRIAIGLLMEKQFMAGMARVRTEWSFASVNERIKMVAWVVLMLVLPASMVTRLRERIAAVFRWGPGGWRRYRPWVPPESVRKLLL